MSFGVAASVAPAHRTSLLTVLTYFVLPSASMKQLRGLNCVQFESGHAYLRVDTSVWCDRESDQFSRLLSIDVPFIILYQSIPVMYAWLLWSSRRSLNPGYRNKIVARAKRDNDPSLAYLKFLFESYEVDRWAFDVFDMVSLTSDGFPPARSHAHPIP